MKLSIAPTLLAVLVSTNKINYAFAQLAFEPECTSSRGYAYDSGSTTSASTTITIASTPWLQLDLSGTELASNAKLLLTGSQTSQEITADALAANSYSAVFDGDSVAVELVTPGNLFRGSSNGNTSQVKISSVNVGLCPEEKDKVASSICGDVDDRYFSFDVRQGRMGGCTAWLISKNVFVWAGHCGTPSSSARIHFTYDSSSAASEDQYAVDIPTYRGVDGGVGNDWGAGRFTQTNDMWPGDRQALRCNDIDQDCDHCAGTGKPCGWYNLPTGPVNPPIGSDMTVTGYGVADVQDRWQKTHVGGLTGIDLTSLKYDTDTTGGNSGSPVEYAGDAIGIHTHGGCSATGGKNHGTRIDQTAFAAHVAFLTKVCTTDTECSNLVGGASCDANNQCQFGIPPTQAPTPAPVCSGGTIKVEITTDNYPLETSWTLTNTVTNTQVASRAAGDYTQSATTHAPVQTCDDDNDAFSFTIEDTYGDGICCGGNGDGSYTIKYNGVVVATSIGNPFTSSSETKTFSGAGIVSSSPSKSPTSSPTAPTTSPTRGPTPPPVPPTPLPSKAPSTSPTTASPSKEPTPPPSQAPTTKAPSTSPTLRPTPSPTPFACSNFSKNNCPAGLCSASGNQCNDCLAAGNSCKGQCTECCNGGSNKKCL